MTEKTLESLIENASSRVWLIPIGLTRYSQLRWLCENTATWVVPRLISSQSIWLWGVFYFGRSLYDIRKSYKKNCNTK